MPSQQTLLELLTYNGASHPAADATAETVVAAFREANSHVDALTGLPVVPGGGGKSEHFSLGVRISEGDVVLFLAVAEGPVAWAVRTGNPAPDPRDKEASLAHFFRWRGGPHRIVGYKVMLKPDTCEEFELNRIYFEEELIALLNAAPRLGYVWGVTMGAAIAALDPDGTAVGGPAPGGPAPGGPAPGDSAPGGPAPGGPAE